MANAINETPEYQAGFLAYKRGISYNSQPFGLDDLKNRAWHMGWHEAADSVQTVPVIVNNLPVASMPVDPAPVNNIATNNSLSDEQMILPFIGVDEDISIQKQIIAKILSIYIPAAQLDDVVNEIMFKIRSSGHKIVRI